MPVVLGAAVQVNRVDISISIVSHSSSATGESSRQEFFDGRTASYSRR